MRRGEDLSRTVATFIVQKMLSDKNGLEYICGTAERFFAVIFTNSIYVFRYQLSYRIWWKRYSKKEIFKTLKTKDC